MARADRVSRQDLRNAERRREVKAMKEEVKGHIVEAKARLDKSAKARQEHGHVSGCSCLVCLASRDTSKAISLVELILGDF